MSAHLKVVEGKPEGASIPLRGPSFLIGRDPACHLRPKHHSVDPKHCRLSVKTDCVSVRDLGSREGTELNGRKLSPSDSVIAFNGDRLRVGNLVFEVAIPAEVHRDRLVGEDEPGEDSAAAIANRLLQQNLARGPEPIKAVGGYMAAEMVEGVPVVRVDIPKIVDDGVVPLRRELRNLSERPSLTRVVLDFHNVRRMSTEGAEVLLAFHDRMKARRAAVKLCEVAPEVLRVLEAVGATERMVIAFDIHDAIWSSW